MSDSHLIEIQKMFPGATEEDAMHLLWTCSAFPCNGIEAATLQLAEMAERAGGNMDAAIAIAHDDLDRGMLRFRLKELADAIPQEMVVPLSLATSLLLELLPKHDEKERTK